MMKRYCLAFIVCFGLHGIMPSTSSAERLNEVALFNRCYAHLTQSRPTRSDPLLAQVKAGTKTAVQACTETLDRARLTANGNTKIADDNDKVAKSVINNFYQLHRSWSREQLLFKPLDTYEEIGTEAWFDDAPYGAYVTRALLSPSSDVLSIVRTNDFPQAVRTDMNPPHTYRFVPSTNVGSESDWRLGTQQAFAPRGDLLGIRAVSLPDVTIPVRFTDLTDLPNFNTLGVPFKATQSITNGINFADITAVRGPITETTAFAIRIRGSLQVPTAGSYRLYLNVDDGGAVYVDSTRVVNRTFIGEGFGDVTLTAGTHALEVQYRQRFDAARMIFSWQGPGITKQAVPTANLINLQAEYATERISEPVRFTANEGGGFLGNQNYLLGTFLESDLRYVPDGAKKVNRSWARAVLKDAFCRDLPVVRESDVTQFVIPTSTTPFRQAATCSACHATMDRQAGVIRGLRWSIMGSIIADPPLIDLIGVFNIAMNAPTMPAVNTWSDVADPDYAKRQPTGRLYFRNYRGELVDRVVNSLSEMGVAISEQDDYFACFAKRYYYYFLGIDVDLGDPGNPLYVPPNAQDQYHRNKVIDLGLRLKNHKSLRQLLVDIMSSEEYRMSDFGVTYKGAGQ